MAARLRSRHVVARLVCRSHRRAHARAAAQTRARRVPTGRRSSNSCPHSSKRHNLPQATLAATIIVAVLSLIDFSTVRHTWRYSRSDFLAMATTIVIVLTVGVEAGLLAGVTLSILLYLWRTSRPHIAIVGQVPGTEHFRNVERHSVVTSPTVLSVRVDESGVGHTRSRNHCRRGYARRLSGFTHPASAEAFPPLHSPVPVPASNRST